MPRKSIDYNKTVIYKIQHADNPELLYVGSTTDFIERKSSHRRACNYDYSKYYNTKLYTMIRDNGGWGAFEMEIIKEFPCENKRQAEAEEERVIRQMKANMNTMRPYVAPEEKQERKSKYNKEYRKTHIDEILEYQQEYRKTHIEEKLEYNKQYYPKHKDEISEHHKEYYKQNKNKILGRLKVKVMCPCGQIYTHGHKARHIRTKFHQNNLQNMPTEE
jgi:hypothetical protein